ncbi:PLP-dependent transferase [Massarina eburnea CBS 473.64]|uniref:PLP-dependent transferase n=1 Tax=Massarina eburnea CBS 473.64 TaxID=1395130 RepID=A0A6A6SDZ6_9PLEO|nr:PLP-dependent transferase [Massarina eburnea CBS 473.64]
MSRVPTPLWHKLIAVQIYGANTGVGKTVFSTLLGAHFVKRRGPRTWDLQYIKPVSTGPADEADDSYVLKYTGAKVQTLFQFKAAVSPHLAARGAAYLPNNDAIVKKVYTKLRDHVDLILGENMGISIIETAGGVLSPGPSGRLQADLFRPLRMPVVLVGDHRLGGIASTISAAESLILRGYDIDAVICFDDNGKYENSEYLRKYFEERDIAAFELPWIPNLTDCTESEETERMAAYYFKESAENALFRVAERIIERHFERLTNVDKMASRTRDVIWHPFTQHKSIKKTEEILVFDSAYGDYFQTKHTSSSRAGHRRSGNLPLFYPAFDGSASWWTQGVGHGNPKLSLAAAYAAGRYGHVMFAGATHEPAVTLAERLLEGLNNPRLKKCFYTDDGSTAAEVGLKMALRASCKRYAWDSSSEDIGVIGLKGSYHGDTIGAMDASEPCVYNKKVDWYRGRGYWFDFPTVKMREGRWIVEPPAGMDNVFGAPKDFTTLDDVFNFEQRDTAPMYEEYITSVLDNLVKEQGRKFGALVMEPVILGAGGMLFADPLFQRTLVKVVRAYSFAKIPKKTMRFRPDIAWTGLPVLFDEVFTGLYRLGRFSSASLLQTHPDISIHAKLLTGGLLPLSVTVASQSIFDAFFGDEKADALLHGHSYTAHPIGCHVANNSLQMMDERKAGYSWQGYVRNWKEKAASSRGETVDQLTMRPKAINESTIWSMWSKNTVIELSHHTLVDHVIAIGSVLAVSLKDEANSGYTSTAAIGLRDALLNQPSFSYLNIHSRVLGNVIYFMASMTSSSSHLASVEDALLQRLNAMSGVDLSVGDWGDARKRLPQDVAVFSAHRGRET